MQRLSTAKFDQEVFDAIKDIPGVKIERNVTIGPGGKAMSAAPAVYDPAEVRDPEAIRQLQEIEVAITAQEVRVASVKEELKEEKKQLAELMESLRNAVKELTQTPLEQASRE